MEDIMFWNFNTEEVEKLLNEVDSKVTDGMTENEKTAYRLGVTNALSLMNQMLEDGDKDDHVSIYKKGKLEEFTLEEIIEWLENRE